LDAFPARCYLEQTGQVFPLQADNANGINITEFPFTLGESPRGYFDGIVRRTLFTAERFEQPAGLLATTAAQLSDGYRSSQAIDNLTRMSPQ